MMNHTRKYLSFLLIACMLGFSACSKDGTPEIQPDEPEKIKKPKVENSVDISKLTLEDIAIGAVVKSQSEDANSIEITIKSKKKLKDVSYKIVMVEDNDDAQPILELTEQNNKITGNIPAVDEETTYNISVQIISKDGKSTSPVFEKAVQLLVKPFEEKPVDQEPQEEISDNSSIDVTLLTADNTLINIDETKNSESPIDGKFQVDVQGGYQFTNENGEKAQIDFKDNHVINYVVMDKAGNKITAKSATTFPFSLELPLGDKVQNMDIYITFEDKNTGDKSEEIFIKNFIAVPAKSKTGNV